MTPLRRVFYRGLHRVTGPRSVTVADVSAQLAGDYLPAGVHAPTDALPFRWRGVAVGGGAR